MTFNFIGRAAALALGLAACAPGVSVKPPLTVVAADPSEAPLAGLSADWIERFQRGDALFSTVEHESQGLGPAYIRPSCQSCHREASRGPGAQIRMVVTEDDGINPAADQSALPWGNLARPLTAGGATTGVSVPSDVDHLLVTVRIGPAMFGRGYLEAVDDSEIERVEADEAAKGIVSGRIDRVAWEAAVEADPEFADVQPGDDGLIGRFGMKANIPTIDGFVAQALQGDIAITSPYLPDELPNPDGLTDDEKPGVDVNLDAVRDLATYVRLLAIPRRDSPDNGGAELFERVGCSECHVPTLHTRSDYPIPALADIDAPIYSDLLLHDRGDGLADGIAQGDATGREWRTAPLIGLRFLGSYMHDGRASTLPEAIATHAGIGSESAFAVANFNVLTQDEQQDLLDWLISL